MLPGMIQTPVLVLGFVLLTLVMGCDRGSQIADTPTPDVKVAATTDVPITNTPTPQPTETLRAVSPVRTSIATLVPTSTPLPTPTPIPTPADTPTQVPAIVGTVIFQPSLEPIVQHISIESAVSYGSGATVDGPPVDLLLDLFLPDTGGLGLRPLAVYIHRGAFVVGSRAGPGFYKEAAQRGWVVASIDYRLRDDNPLPGPRMQKMLDALGGPSSSALYRSVVAAVEDTLTALDYLLDRAEELYIDPDRIVLIGASAGAVTALNVAYTADTFGIDRPDIAAVVDLWGSIPESFGEESTMDPRESPLFIIHGTEDTVVTFDRALNLVKGAESAGIPYEFHPQKGAGHGFGQISLGTDTTADGRSLESAVFEFLDRVLY